MKDIFVIKKETQTLYSRRIYVLQDGMSIISKLTHYLNKCKIHSSSQNVFYIV